MSDFAPSITRGLQNVTRAFVGLKPKWNTDSYGDATFRWAYQFQTLLLSVKRLEPFSRDSQP